MRHWPNIAVITPGSATCSEELLPRVRALYELGLRMCILREPHLGAAQHTALGQAVAQHCPELCLVHHLKCPATRAIVREATVPAVVHLPAAYSQQDARSPGMFGVSTHTQAELLRAEQLGASYALLSPVWTPNSKPADGRSTLGPGAFARLSAQVDLPVYALGGVDAVRCSQLPAGPRRRVALIGGLMRDPWPQAREQFTALQRAATE